MSETQTPILDLTAGIAAAYVAHNHVAAAELPALLTMLHAALSGLGTGTTPDVCFTPVSAEHPSPGQIRKSVQPDGLVSFLDGRSYKTLKRHLTAHGLNPGSYRARYGLPADYPMVCPAYSARRSSLAKAIGLGGSISQAHRQAA